MRRFLLAALVLVACQSSESSEPDAAGSPVDAAVADLSATSDLADDATSDALEAGRDAAPEPLPHQILAFSPAMGTFVGLIGTTSPPQQFILASVGDGTTGLPQVSLGGTHQADFLISHNDCVAALAAGTFCAIEVTFKPAVVGRKTATLNVTASPGGMAVAVLEGQATDGDGVALEPPFADFGGVMVGATSPPVTWKLQNTGGAPVVFGAVTVTSPEFILGADTCTGATVKAGELCTFQIAFRPTTAGQQAGLVLVDAGSAGKAVATLSGAGL